MCDINHNLVDAEPLSRKNVSNLFDYKRLFRRKFTDSKINAFKVYGVLEIYICRLILCQWFSSSLGNINSFRSVGVSLCSLRNC